MSFINLNDPKYQYIYTDSKGAETRFYPISGMTAWDGLEYDNTEPTELLKDEERKISGIIRPLKLRTGEYTFGTVPAKMLRFDKILN